MGDLFTTCFDPKGLSAVNTCIKINKKSCWVMSGLYLNGNLINRFILQGNCGVYEAVLIGP